MDNWKPSTLGDFVSLQRGIDLPETRRKPGNIPVMGSFGITGYHDEARVVGPGVTVGRSGASFGAVSYSPVDYWPLNTVLYVKDFHGNDPNYASQGGEGCQLRIRGVISQEGLRCRRHLPGSLLSRQGWRGCLQVGPKLLQGGLNDRQPFGRRQLLQFCQEVEALHTFSFPGQGCRGGFLNCNLPQFLQFFLRLQPSLA